jgi:hypothetical protein
LTRAATRGRFRSETRVRDLPDATHTGPAHSRRLAGRCKWLPVVDKNKNTANVCTLSFKLFLLFQKFGEVEVDTVQLA